MFKTKRHGRIAIAVNSALAISLLGVSSPILSQEESAIETISVTGSYIKRSPKNSSIPTQYLGAEQILDDPSVDMAGVLSKLPATNGNLVTQNSDDSGGGQSAAGISLRNLGTGATLILLNGQRQPSLGTPTDVNSLIPKVMVDRVEVVKDGASASYGSEAIAGVINFITNRHFEGAKVNVDLSKLDAADDLGGSIGAMFGVQNDTTSSVFGIEYNERALLKTPNRFDDKRIAEYGQVSIFGNPGTFSTSNGLVADPLCGSDSLGGSPQAGFMAGPFCRFDLTSERGMVTEQKRLTSFVTIDHTITDELRTEFEAGYAYTDQFIQQVRFPILGATLPASNPFNPFGEDVGLFYRQSSNVVSDNNFNIISGGHTLQHTFRTTGKVQYDLNDTWTATLGGGFNLVNLNSNNTDTHLSRFNAALNCEGGANADQCFNPFASAYLASHGDAEYNDPELYDWFNADFTTNSQFKLTTFDFILNGEFENPFHSDSIGVAYGAQYRKESAAVDYADVQASGQLSFIGASQDFEVSRDVNSLFAELLLPLTDNTEVNFAGRYDDYSTGESTFTPKLSALWHASPELSLRASAGTSFRVATLGQLLGGEGLQNVVDPLTGLEFNGVQSTTVANPDLSPEEGLNWNLGATWQPTKHVTISIDHFSIELKDRIYTETLSGIIAEDVNSSRVIRDENNNILSSILTTQNGGKFETAGFDLAAKADFEVAVGVISTELNGSYTYKFDVQERDGTVVDGAGSYNRQLSGVAPLPKIKGNFTVGLRTASGFSISTILRYTGEVTMDDPGLIGRTEEKSWLTADVQAFYEINEASSISVSIENITDNDPPAVGNSIYTADGLLYDLRGRGINLSYNTEF